MTERRLHAGTVVAGLVAGGLLLWAATRTWVAVTVRTPGLPVDRVTVDGGTAVPLVTASALVVMAGSLAVPAVRGWFRVAVGAVLVLAAAAAGVGVARAAGATDAALRRALTESPAVAGDRATVARLAATADPTAWRWVALAGAVVALACGLVVVLRGRGWSAMGRRFDAPGTGEDRGPSGAASRGDSEGDGEGDDGAAELWQALDRGEDPTA